MTAPAGFRSSRAGPADAHRVAALMTAADLEQGVREETAVEDVLEGWRRIDLERDAWLLEREGGTLSAYADLTIVATRRLRSDGYVHPDARGFGLGTALVRLAEGRAREAAAHHGWDGGALLFNAVLATDLDAGAALEAEGYRPARRFLRMAIGLERAPAAILPDGLEVRPFEPGRDARAVHAALEEAMEDHWDPVHVPFGEWRERHLEGLAVDPGLWIVVRDGDEVAGVALCKAKVHDRGNVDSLAVREPWRGRGLGLALLQLAFAAFWRRGERQVALAVDSDNLTGATRLYERAGMHVEYEMAVYEKALS